MDQKCADALLCVSCHTWFVFSYSGTFTCIVHGCYGQMEIAGITKKGPSCNKAELSLNHWCPPYGRKQCHRITVPYNFPKAIFFDWLYDQPHNVHRPAIRGGHYVLATCSCKTWIGLTWPLIHLSAPISLYCASTPSCAVVGAHYKKAWAQHQVSDTFKMLCKWSPVTPAVTSWSLDLVLIKDFWVQIKHQLYLLGHYKRSGVNGPGIWSPINTPVLLDS